VDYPLLSLYGKQPAPKPCSAARAEVLVPMIASGLPLDVVAVAAEFRSCIWYTIRRTGGR
jgi:hypothetical protein